VVSFIGLKTKVGGKNMEPTKKDWKLYRERIGDWQEAYGKTCAEICGVFTGKSTSIR